MPFYFQTPSVTEGPSGQERLFQFYKLTRGVTVYRVGSNFSTVRYPSQDFLETVDEYWLGGHTYTVDNTTAASLSAAGFGDYLTEIV